MTAEEEDPVRALLAADLALIPDTSDGMISAFASRTSGVWSVLVCRLLTDADRDETLWLEPVKATPDSVEAWLMNNQPANSLTRVDLAPAASRVSVVARSVVGDLSYSIGGIRFVRRDWSSVALNVAEDAYGLPSLLAVRHLPANS